jgi:hypothetical protein
MRKRRGIWWREDAAETLLRKMPMESIKERDLEGVKRR